MGEITQLVRVHGVRVKALVDTGARDNYLSARIAKKVKLYLEGDEYFMTASGKKYRGKLAHISIDVGGRQGTTSVVVTGILPQDNIDLVLGQTYLQDNDVILDFHNDKIMYGSHQPRIRKMGRLW